MYCVNCGVELDKTAGRCALCGTAVYHPNEAVAAQSPPPYPPEERTLGPASRLEVALLLSVMFSCAAVACIVLNLFLRTDRLWSLYAVGACVLLWVWIVPGLLTRRIPLWLCLLWDAIAVGVYVFLISLDLNGAGWFAGLAAPIVLLGAAGVVFLGILIGGGRRSILTGITLIIATVGVFLLGVELFIDRYLTGVWQPGWSLVVAIVSAALVIPLIVVRRVPRLREEVRRRFHM